MLRVGTALLVSAILLLSASGYHLQGQNSGGAELTVPMTVVIGRSVSDRGDNQVIPAEDGRAIFAGRVKQFAAADYPFLRLELSGQKGVEDILFFYRQADESSSLRSLLLPLHPGQLSWCLGDEDGWKGTISEVGLIVYGDESTWIAVESLSLLPSSSRISMEAELSRWLAVWRWDQRTINFLPWDGGRIAPVPAVAAWLLLALLMLWVMKGPKRWQLAASLVVVGWLLLDVRWFLEQYRQWSDLDNQIVAYPEGAVLTADAGLYQELERVKRDVLPDEPVRIQIVRDGSATTAGL